MKNLLFILLFVFTANQLFAQLKFKANIKKIELGDSVQLTWQVQNIKKIKTINIKNLAENLEPQGSVFVKPEKSKSYKLEVFTSKKNKKYRKGVWIEVIQPQITHFNTVNQYNNDRDSTELYWKTENTDYVLIENIEQKLPPEGKIKLMLDTTTIIKLKAFNKNNIPVEKELNVAIKNIEYLKGEHNPFLYDTTSIKWQYKYCNYVKINGIDKKFKPKDEFTFVALKDTTYYLQIFKENGDTLKKTFSVKVRSPLKKFKVPEVVFEGMPVTMFWDVKEGFSVKLTGTGKIITQQKGAVKIPQDTDKKYTITVRDNKGKIIVTETKKIKKIKSPVKVFSVPENAFVGVPVKIVWDVEPMFTVGIEGLSKKLSNMGKAKVVPYADRKYIMIVYYHGKEIKREERTMTVERRRKYIHAIVDYKDLEENTKLNFEVFAVDESNFPNEVKLYALIADKEGNFVHGLEKLDKNSKTKLIKS
ncbi:MAG: hypothetical protein L3J74_08940, partial [Bacteroidales bacterium]|nr:hypothetical protein [Bacteroidales bacterium]